MPFIRLWNRFKVRANLERLDQARKAREFVRAVLNLAEERSYSIGQVLWFCLPVQAAKALVNSEVDPYKVSFDTVQMLEWVENHVVFGNDIEIIAVHDYGRVLWNSVSDLNMEWYKTKEH